MNSLLVFAKDTVPIPPFLMLVLSRWSALLLFMFLIGCGNSPNSRPQTARISPETGEWVAGDGKMGTFLSWQPSEKPGAVWILVHGFSGAATDLGVLAENAEAWGDAAFAPNLRGMGIKGEAVGKGDVASSEEWAVDLDEFVGRVRAEFPGTPVFVAGESLGASIILQWVADPDRIEADPHGVVFLSPVVEFGLETTWWQRRISELFLWLNPGRRIELQELEDQQNMEDRPPMTPIPAEQEKLKNAPHRLKTASLRFLAAAIEAVNESEQNLPALAGIPRLLAHGGRDAFISSERVAGFAERFAALNGPAEVVFYPEGHHLLLRDRMAEDLLETIKEWRFSAFRPRLRSPRGGNGNADDSIIRK